MNLHHLCPLATVLLLVATPSRAGWEGTDWGMTMAEVLAANHQIPKLVPAAGIMGAQENAADVVLRMDHAVAASRFNVAFLLGSDGLYQVNMTALESQADACPDVVALLSARWGPATAVEVDETVCLVASCPATTTWLWRDIPDGSAITVETTVSGIPQDLPWSCTATFAWDSRPRTLLPE